MSICPYAPRKDERCWVSQRTPEALDMAEAYCYEAWQRCAIYKEFLSRETPAAAGTGNPEREEDDVPDLETVKQALREVLAEEAGRADRPLGKKWQGGSLVLLPKDRSQASKDIPIEAFFKKVVAVRDRLRVLEQKLNAHEALSNEDKAAFQDYITKCYGSLTTFNVLFRDKEDHFVGTGAG